VESHSVADASVRRDDVTIKRVKRSTQRLDRTIFSTSRAAEYFRVKELEKMTGQTREKFAEVVLKELHDNALDGCETAGVAPEVGIETSVVGGYIIITVSDNGPGIPPEVVRRILDYDTRTSDKAQYRSTTRGTQGNALKAVIGIPHALGSKAPIIIESCGVRHEVKPRVLFCGGV
jgi:DNA topoisomerase VI subunit B